jgi:hypothetical protein
MDASQIIKDTTTDAGMANSSNMLASSHVLLGTTLLDGLDETPRAGFEDMYTGLNEQNDTNIPFRPYPVIESAEIKTVGKLGSLRKAIVNFKCFTLEQLQQMEILYMTPGASCVLQ